LEIAVGGDTLARLAALSEDPERYWETRSKLAWN
jgi:hypothetical protein